MCGIAGIATVDGLRGEDPRLVDRMLQSLAHRGPDDQYMRGDGKALLGARRLSIIDLQGGRQPLSDESGQILVTQNGEIYNYVELRTELERRGHRFRTQSDTETIVHLYEEHGTAFVDHLRGMFAVAIWDGRSGRLVLARDRLGKKPLYWRLARGRLSYGSELKAILEDPDTDREVNREALALYLQYQYVPAPWSILRGVAQLPAAGILTWDGGDPQSHGTGRLPTSRSQAATSVRTRTRGWRSSVKRFDCVSAAMFRSGLPERGYGLQHRHCRDG